MKKNPTVKGTTRECYTGCPKSCVLFLWLLWRNNDFSCPVVVYTVAKVRLQAPLAEVYAALEK